jgi:hypothetical protein
VLLLGRPAARQAGEGDSDPAAPAFEARLPAVSAPGRRRAIGVVMCPPAAGYTEAKSAVTPHAPAHSSSERPGPLSGPSVSAAKFRIVMGPAPRGVVGGPIVLRPTVTAGCQCLAPRPGAGIYWH